MIADIAPAAETGDNIEFVRTDATSAEQVASLIDTTHRKWDRIDILVNNA